MTDNPNEPNNEPNDTPSYELDDTPMFTKKTETQLMKSMYSTMLQKMLVPDPLTQALNDSMREMAVDAIKSKFLGGGAPQKSSWFTDILNTAAAHGFGESLGAKLPETMQALGNVFGQKKAGEIVDKVTDSINKTQQHNQQIDQENNMMKQQTAILNLDVNNIDHVKQYATAMVVDISDAQQMLIEHQKRIQQTLLKQQSQPEPSQQQQTLIQQSQQPQSEPSQPLQQNQVSQQEAIMLMIEEMKAMKAEIQHLKGEKQEKINKEIGDRGSPINIEQKNVKLFQSAIKVDIDDIDSSAKDDFFKEQPKESKLIEEKDEDGKSSFRMSDDEPKKKIEIKHQAVKPIKPIEPKKEIDVEKMNDVILEELNDTKETLEKEEDKPKEDTPPEPEIKKEETKEEVKAKETETPKVEEVKEELKKKAILRKKV